MLWCWTAAFAASLPDLDEPLRTGASAPEDSAVVVGLGDYVFLPDVPYADRDATLVRDFLLSTRGVPRERVTVLSSGSREQIEAAVAGAGERTGAKGTVWLYFAGHGVASPRTGHRLLLGDDTRQAPEAFDARGVELDALVASAGSHGARVVTWVDACFNGTGRDGAPVVSGTRFAVPVWVGDAEAGRLSWAAAGPDQFARPLDVVQHGAFTWLAIGALRGWADGELDGARDGVVTAAEASTYVERALERLGLTDQDPVLVGAADWRLSERAPESPPELRPERFVGAPGGPVGPAPAPGRPGSINADLAGDWDPALVAKADAMGVHLPLRKTLIGYKDLDGDRLNRSDFERLAKATRRGRAGTTMRSFALPSTVVGFGLGFGGMTWALMNDTARDGGPIALGVGGGTLLVGGIGLLLGGQAMIEGAVQPR